MSYRDECPAHHEKLSLFCTECMKFRCDYCEDAHVGMICILHGNQIYMLLLHSLYQTKAIEINQRRDSIIKAYHDCISSLNSVFNKLMEDCYASQNQLQHNLILCQVSKPALDMLCKLKPHQSIEIAIEKMIASIQSQLDWFSEFLKSLQNNVKDFTKAGAFKFTPYDEKWKNKYKIESTNNPINILTRIPQNQIYVQSNYKTIFENNYFSFSDKAIKKITNAEQRRVMFLDYPIKVGIASWVVKIDSITCHVGVGISSDLNHSSFHDLYLYRDGESSGLTGTSSFGVGAILTFNLNMSTKEFKIFGPNFIGIGKVNKDCYYPCFGGYSEGDALSVLLFTHSS